jgi:restriction system protein
MEGSAAQLFHVLELTLKSAWWLWAIVAGIAVARLASRIWQSRRLSRSGIRDVDVMDGTTFELFLVTLFRRLGYDARHTGKQGDFGADLVVERDGRRSVVQAKRSTSRVGAKAVQEVVAAKAMYDCAGAVVVTNGRFTEHARKLARSNDVSLWDRDMLVRQLLDARGIEEAVDEAHCATCGARVSEKVRAYCVAHAARFGGRTYCFTHQRHVAAVTRH